MTGMTSSTIHSGLLPDSQNASSTLRRLASFLRLASLVASFISVRSCTDSLSTSIFARMSRIASAPIPYLKEFGPNSSLHCMSRSSLSSSPRRSAVSIESITMCDSK